jgi:hypothetical protein
MRNRAAATPDAAAACSSSRMARRNNPQRERYDRPHEGKRQCEQSEGGVEVGQTEAVWNSGSVCRPALPAVTSCSVEKVIGSAGVRYLGTIVVPGFVDIHNHPAHFLSKGLFGYIEAGRRWRPASVRHPSPTHAVGQKLLFSKPARY